MSLARGAWMRSRRLSSGALLIAVAFGAAAIGVLSVALVLRANDRDPEAREAVVSPSRHSLERRFAVLNRASSNRCGLLSTGLDELARNGRLQGACCRRMDLHRYVEQITALRRYAQVPEIPTDPYDISVSLALRLLAYQKLIELPRGQQEIYNWAIELSEEGGPCCCDCWRWSAFEGQAKFLISRRRYRAEQVAELWSLEDGCGGSGHVHRA